MRPLLRWCRKIVFLCLLSQSVYGQFNVYVAPTYNWVRQHHLVGEVEGAYGVAVGASGEVPVPGLRALRHYASLEVVSRGYRQHIGGDTYRTSLGYFSSSTGICYRPLPFLSLRTGIWTALRLRAGQYVNQSLSRIKVGENYRRVDVRGELSLWLLENRLAGVFITCQMGWVPQVKMRYVDAQGTLLGPKRDLYFRTVQLGVNFNIGKNDY